MATGESQSKPVDRDAQVNEPPPVGGSWRNVYLFVLGTLVVTIVVLFAVTRAFS